MIYILRIRLTLLVCLLFLLASLADSNISNLWAKDDPLTPPLEMVLDHRPIDFTRTVEKPDGTYRVYLSCSTDFPKGHLTQTCISTRFQKDKTYIFANTLYFESNFDEKFPVWGRVYQRGSVTKLEKGFQIICKRLEAKDIPKGVTVTPGTITILCAKDYTKFGTIPSEYPETFYSESQATVIAKVPEKGEPTFEIEIPNGLRTVFKKAPAKVGDIVVFSKKGYKIVSFTPPNEKEKIIGWIELDPKFTPLHELIEKKIPFIDPLESKDEKKDK